MTTTVTLHHITGRQSVYEFRSERIAMNDAAMHIRRASVARVVVETPSHTYTLTREER